MVLAPRDTPGAVSLDGGRYGVHLSESTVAEIDVPDGWETEYGAFFHPNPASDRKGIVHIVGTSSERTMLPADPCRDQTFAEVGPTVDDLADGLAALPFLQTIETAGTSVGAVDARFVELRIPPDADLHGCQKDRVTLYRSGGGDVWTAGPEGAVIRLWVLEVHGTRYVIHAQWGKSARDLATMTEMVRSITFTRDAPSGGR